MTKFHYPKIASLIYHIVEKMGQVDGRTRLVKLIYMSDQIAAEHSEQTISNARFYSYTHGPYAKEILETLREMRGFWVDEIAEPLSNGNVSYHYVISGFPHNPAEMELGLADSEKGIVDVVIEEWGKVPLREILDHVYSSEPYAGTPLGEDIKMMHQFAA